MISNRTLKTEISFFNCYLTLNDAAYLGSLGGRGGGIKVSHFRIMVSGVLNFHSSYTLAQCFVSYFGDPWKFSMVFFVVFQASKARNFWEKITEKKSQDPEI